MLTTTVDGLWLLQVLAGIEEVAPELGLRPHLPSVETKPAALHHPVAEELIAAGVITRDGAVDEPVREWLTVLSRREVALLLYAQSPVTASDPERVLLARFAQWWVTIERHNTLVRLSGTGKATSEQCARRLVTSQINRLCGQSRPAALRPASLSASALLTGVQDQQSLRSVLKAHKLDVDQTEALMHAADCTQSAQSTIVAIQYGAEGAKARSYIGAGAVSIVDTARGRLVCEHVRRDGKDWLVIGPGSAGYIACAIQAMLRRLPAGIDWYSHRKAV